MPSPSEKIKVKCSHCEKTIRAPLKMAGKSGKCPGCGHKITIPRLAASPDQSQRKSTLKPAPTLKPKPAPPIQPPKQPVASQSPPVITPPSIAQPIPAVQPTPAVATSASPVTSGPTSVASPSRTGGFFGENWQTILFWLPCALLCLMSMLYGVITIMAYSSGPSGMGSFLSGRMLNGLCMLLAGLAAYAITAFCVSRFCKNKNKTTKIILYVACLLCMLGVGFVLLVFNSAWHTAWLVMLDLDLTWITWLTAWPLVGINLALIVFHAITTKAPNVTPGQAIGEEPLVSNQSSHRPYWLTAAAAPVALLICSTLFWLVFPPSKKPRSRQRASVSPQRVIKPGTPDNKSKAATSAFQPKRVELNYTDGKLNITRFEEVAWILSENYSSDRIGFDEMAAAEWLNNNELNTNQQASLISLLTPYFSSTEPTLMNRKILGFHMVERYGGPDQIEIVASTLGSDNTFIESGKVLTFVAKHCKGSESNAVIDYLMNSFSGRNSIHSIGIDYPNGSETDPKKIAEDALVLIGDPVLKRHGSKISANDDTSFQRLAIRLKKLSGPELARESISQIDMGEKRLATAYLSLRELELASAHHSDISNAITAKLNIFLQAELKNSLHQDAMISLAAALPKWQASERSFPMIAKAIDHATIRNNYGQLDQQYLDIFEFASQSDTPAAAEVLVALLQHAYYPQGMERETICQEIRDLGGKARDALLPLMASNSTTNKNFASEIIEGLGGVNQTVLLEQLFAGGKRNILIKELKSMEIEPANQAYVARQIRERDLMGSLKELYFGFAAEPELEHLKELANTGINSYHYPALKRLLEIDFQQGVDRMKEIYRGSANDLPFREIERAADTSFEPALLQLLDDTSLTPNRYFLEIFEHIGTAKSLPSLKSFIKRIKSKTPKDKRERVRNGYLIDAANAAIEKINSNN
jgi:hypothetical protein